MARSECVVTLVPIVRIVVIYLGDPFSTSMSLTPYIRIVSGVRLIVRSNSVLNRSGLLSIMCVEFYSRYVYTSIVVISHAFRSSIVTFVSFRTGAIYYFEDSSRGTSDVFK